MIEERKRSFYNIEAIKNKAKVNKIELESIHKTTLFKYKLMRIRSKISFCAFKKNMTISELILKQIAVSFEHFVKLGEIKLTEHEQNMGKKELYDQICFN